MKDSKGFIPHLKRISFAKRGFNKSSLGAGFTLVEILVVAAIMATMSTFLIINFSRTRLNLDETVNALISDIRAAQEKALASAKYDSGGGSKIRCGYGIKYRGITSYSMYAGPDATTIGCSAQNRNYDANDAYVFTRNFMDSRVEFKGSFNDIFFEPPFPTTFINNSSATGSVSITIGKIGGACPQDCKTLNVSTSGKIE